MAAKKKLRSHDWFGEPGIDSMVHRSWMQNQGLPPHLKRGRLLYYDIIHHSLYST